MPHIDPVVQPLAHAGLLLAATRVARDLGLHGLPTASEILAATGATRSRAYELSAEVIDSLPKLTRPPGRPAASVSSGEPPPPSAELEATLATLDHVLAHPGCACHGDKRRRYSDGFVAFVLDLIESHSDLSLETIARCTRVPLGTLKAWAARPRAVGAPVDDIPSQQDPGTPRARGRSMSTGQIETVLVEWKTWGGTFSGFVDHLRHHLRLPLGHSCVSRILQAHRLRTPKRRGGRSPDEIGLRDTFATFFPGAQWVGDGMVVPVEVDGERFTFNLELVVDARTAAWVGLSVTDEETAEAVVDAFDDGIATTGAAPLGLLLDNKACNHTEDVGQRLEDDGTVPVRATRQRPQNKAHVEGAFGLFAQQAPPIVLDTRQGRRSTAHALLLLVATTFARAINHRPRSDRNGRSRVELYASEQASDEDIAKAKQALDELIRKQERKRATEEARQRPCVKAYLDNVFDELGFADPERNMRLAIGRYPIDAIVNGVAIFTAKRLAKTIPEGADHPGYLKGIVVNLTEQRECELIAQALLDERTRARDIATLILEQQRADVCAHSSDVVRDCIDAAFATDRSLDRIFWLNAAADHAGSSAHNLEPLLRRAVNHITMLKRVPAQARRDAVRFLVDRLAPIH